MIWASNDRGQATPAGGRGLALCALSLCCAGCATTALSVADRVLPPVELEGSWHRVEASDDLAALARQHDVPLIDLEEINGIDRDAPPAPGKLLFIPRVEQRAPRRARARRARGPANGPPPLGPLPRAGSLAWPVAVAGQVSSRFGRRQGNAHEGVDLAAPAGTPVLAAEEGTVLYAGAGIRGYGNLIILRHAGDLVTVYAHNRKNLVERGARVQRGQRIAEVGHSGRASGDHLHFEVRRGETPIDPLPYLQQPPPPR